MANFGLTPEGFNLKRLDDIVDELQTTLNQIEDPETGETLNIDLRGDDPFAQAIFAVADIHAKGWEALQLVARSFDPAQNTGAAQSGAVQLNGISRIAGSKSTIPITLTGVSGTVVPANSRISDAQQNTIFLTDVAYTIGVGGTVTGQASTENNGAFTQLINTVTTIITPVSGWTAVNNTADSTLGRVEESDEDLRVRRDQSTEVPSVGPVEAIRGALLQVSGVTFARVLVNNTLTTDSNGITAKAIAAIIVGGNDQEIAQTLFLRTAATANYFGTTTVNITDNQGEVYPIRWIRPTEVDIFINLDITITNSNVFPGNGADLIREAIIGYVQQGASALGITSGFKDLGFVPGEDVTVGRLYTPVNSIDGHTVTTLEIGLSAGTTAVTPITINFDQIAAFSSANIDITVT